MTSGFNEQPVFFGRVLGIDPDSIIHGIRQGEMDNQQKLNGIGTHLTDTSFCQGEYKNGKMDGHAACIDSDGLIEEGHYRNNKLSGYGKRTLPDGTIEEGNFEEDELNGDGKRVLPDGSV